MGLGNILKGHVNELLNLNERLYKQRMDFCDNCPLIQKSIIGKVCSKGIYINQSTGEVINTKNTDELVSKLILNEDFKNGCGCRVEAKTRDIDSFCPLNKW